MGTPSPSQPPESGRPVPQEQAPGFVEGLANHLHLGWRCQEEAYRASRYRRPLTLILIELPAPIDRHAEEGLQRWLRANIRMSDIPAYLGPGRYALLLPETSEEQGRTVEARLLVDFTQLRTRVCAHPREDLRRLVEDQTLGL